MCLTTDAYLTADPGVARLIPVRSHTLGEVDHETISWSTVVECLTRDRGRGFEPHRRHCVVSLCKNINPSIVLVQPRKICRFITERLLMGCKESNQTNKQNNLYCHLRRVVASYKRKNVHKVLVNCLFKLAQEKV